MNCPGSHDLIKALTLPETDDPDYRRQGVAAHAAAAHALQNGLEAWEVVGMEFEGLTITAAMGMHLKVYLDHVVPLQEATQTYGVEFKAHSPSIHEQAFGTADHWAIAPGPPSEPFVDEDGDTVQRVTNALHVNDLKFGEGIAVDVEENPQLKYYAALVIDNLERNRSYVFNDAMLVVLGIVQPRAFHPGGPIRTWTTTVGEIKEWVHDTLRPAMARTEIDGLLTPGDWCRFCPAKLVCPMLQGLFEALCKVDVTHVKNWSDAALDRSYALLPAAKWAAKAIEEEAFRRAMGGASFESAKLVQKKANRVWKGEAEAEARALFGDEAFSKPQLLTPPQLEEAKGPAGKRFAKEYAFAPDTGLTMAPRTDARTEQKPLPTSEVFKQAIEALNNSG